MTSATASVSALLPPPARALTAPVPAAQPLALARPIIQPAFGDAVPTAAPVRTIALEEIVRCVLRHWKAGVIAAGIAGVFVFLLLTSRVPQYQAEASVIMRMRDNKVFNFDPVTDNSGEATSAPFLLNNHRIQLKSRQFLEFFWSRLSPADRAAFLAAPQRLPLIPRIKAAIGGLLPQKAAAGSAEEQQLGAFVGQCELAGVDFIKETLMVKVSLRHHDAATAAKIANGWVTTYMEYTGREETTSARQASEFLSEEADKQRLLVEDAERKYADYCRSNGLVGDEEQKAGDSEKLKLLHSEQAKFEVELDRVTAALRQVKDAGRDLEKLLSVEQLAQEASLGTLRAQLTEKRKQWEMVNATYGPKHPVYINAANEFKSLGSEINQAVARGIAGMQNRESRLVKELTSVRERISDATGQATSISHHNGEKHLLKSKLDAERSLYEKILSRLNEATVSSRFHETTNLRQAETAVPADAPVSPSKPLGLLLGGLSSVLFLIAVPLVLAAAAMLRREGLTGILARMRHAGGGAGVLPMPVAALPAPSSPQPALPAPAPAAAELPQPAAAPVPVPVKSGTDVKLLNLGVVPAAAAPRTRLDQMLAAAFGQNHPARTVLESAAALITESEPGLAPVILVTSQEHEQGKSFIACGLGVAGLAAGRSAVVVDCNVSRPSLSRWLPRLFPGMTLHDMAAAGCIPGDMNALRCGNSQLYTIQAGTPDSSLEGVFSRPWFGQLIAWLRTQVGVVIIDGPAMSDLHDVRALASLSTRAVLVTRPDSSGSRTANAAQFLAGMSPSLETIAGIGNTALLSSTPNSTAV